MKLLLEQDDIRLTLEKDGELDFPTLFKAYQIVTGSDEVLEDLRNISDDARDETREKAVIDKEVHSNVPKVTVEEKVEEKPREYQGAKFESPKKENVEVDLQCPFCGKVKRLKVPEHFNRVFCPDCGECLFLSYATGIRGRVDEEGYYYRACSPMRKKGEQDDYEKMFIDHED